MSLKNVLTMQVFLHLLSIGTVILLGQYAVDEKTAIVTLVIVDSLAFWTISIAFEYKYNIEERIEERGLL